MTVGTGIFLASLVLGVIALFAITKDRWNWAKIARLFALVLVGMTAIAVGGFFVWNAVKESNEATRAKLEQQRETNDAAREKRARQEEERARICIAGDLPRIENLAQSIKPAVRGDMKLEDVKAVTDKLLGIDGHILPPKDDIKERVLIYSLPTACSSVFKLLVNVRADEQGKLRWLRVWAEHPPIGYLEGLHGELSVDFEQDRAQMGGDLAGMGTLKAQRLVSEKQHRIDDDPCGPHLSRDERLRRLAAFGKVRQTGEQNYVADGHRVMFSFDGSLLICE